MRWRRELLLFGAAYLLYNAGRGFTNGDMDLAVANANWVLDFQGGSNLAIDFSSASLHDGVTTAESATVATTNGGVNLRLSPFGNQPAAAGHCCVW